MTGVSILAGAGRLPLTIAERVAASGQPVHIIGFEGVADPAIAAFPHTWVKWGQISRLVEAMRGEGRRDLVVVGAVSRPDLRKVRPDLGFFTSLPQVLRLLGGGDDSVLKVAVRFFESKGLRVRGAHEFVPDLLAPAGRIGAVALGARDQADAALGFAVRQALGVVDAGQAVVVAGGKVLAIEGAEGTDAMLQRVAVMPGRTLVGERSGVLAKGPKPGQELRVDMPAIGPRTIEQAVAAGLSAVVVEAGAVLILDKAEALQHADRDGCAVHGLANAPATSAVSGAIGTIGRVIGRRRPSARDARDIARGLATVGGLAPFGAGGGAVVVRRHVLAIEAGEGLLALLERVQALRQWGLRGERRGVLAIRVGAHAGAPADAVLGQAAAQRLAGVVVTGQADALADYEAAARQADAAGIFLVACSQPA